MDISFDRSLITKRDALSKQIPDVFAAEFKNKAEARSFLDVLSFQRTTTMNPEHCFIEEKSFDNNALNTVYYCVNNPRQRSQHRNKHGTCAGTMVIALEEDGKWSIWGSSKCSCPIRPVGPESVDQMNGGILWNTKREMIAAVVVYAIDVFHLPVVEVKEFTIHGKFGLKLTNGSWIYVYFMTNQDGKFFLATFPPGFSKSLDFGPPVMCLACYEREGVYSFLCDCTARDFAYCRDCFRTICNQRPKAGFEYDDLYISVSSDKDDPLSFIRCPTNHLTKHYYPIESIDPNASMLAIRRPVAWIYARPYFNMNEFIQDVSYVTEHLHQRFYDRKRLDRKIFDECTKHNLLTNEYHVAGIRLEQSRKEAQEGNTEPNGPSIKSLEDLLAVVKKEVEESDKKIKNWTAKRDGICMPEWAMDANIPIPQELYH